MITFLIISVRKVCRFSTFLIKEKLNFFELLITRTTVSNLFLHVHRVLLEKIHYWKISKRKKWRSLTCSKSVHSLSKLLPCYERSSVDFFWHQSCWLEREERVKSLKECNKISLKSVQRECRHKTATAADTFTTFAFFCFFPSLYLIDWKSDKKCLKYWPKERLN